jgi:hypothetical protein
MKNSSNHLRQLLATTRTCWGLNVIGSARGIDAITPDVGAQFGEGEARVMSDDAPAQSRARLALADRAVVEVVHLGAYCGSELFSLGWLGDEEVGAQVHGYTVMVEVLVTILDHSGLSVQTFLDVYQKGKSNYSWPL